jgi:hypothetical protein
MLNTSFSNKIQLKIKIKIDFFNWIRLGLILNQIRSSWNSVEYIYCSREWWIHFLPFHVNNKKWINLLFTVWRKQNNLELLSMARTLPQILIGPLTVNNILSLTQHLIHWVFCGMNYEAFFTRRKKVLTLLIFFYCKKNSIENRKVYTALNEINRGFYVLTNNKEFVNCN